MRWYYTQVSFNSIIYSFYLLTPHFGQFSSLYFQTQQELTYITTGQFYWGSLISNFKSVFCNIFLSVNTIDFDSHSTNSTACLQRANKDWWGFFLDIFFNLVISCKLKIYQSGTRLHRHALALCELWCFYEDWETQGVKPLILINEVNTRNSLFPRCMKMPIIFLNKESRFHIRKIKLLYTHKQ